MSVKKKIKTIGWSALGLCCVVLLVAAMKSKDAKPCNNVKINIKGVKQHLFVTNEEVLSVLNKNNIHAGENLDEINLRKTEALLNQNVWIKEAQLFFDNHQILHVNITEREPVARVFTVNGNSFYIDSTGLRLPLNENAVARLVVFTSFPSAKEVLSKPDSLMLNDVKAIAMYITADSFLNKQTAQVNITTEGKYEIIPVVGNQVIRIGNADDLDEKFTKLLAFYKQVWNKVGFEKYSVIDVQYKGQVVAVKRDGTHVRSDTAKALVQLASADKKLNKALNDTTYAASLPGVNIDTVNVLVKDEAKKPKAVMKKSGP